MVKLSIDISEDIANRLSQAAQNRASTVETLIREALLDAVASEDWLRAEIEAGLQAADAGDFASPGEVDALRQRFR